MKLSYDKRHPTELVTTVEFLAELFPESVEGDPRLGKDNYPERVIVLHERAAAILTQWPAAKPLVTVILEAADAHPYYAATEAIEVIADIDTDFRTNAAYLQAYQDGATKELAEEFKGLIWLLPPEEWERWTSETIA